MEKLMGVVMCGGRSTRMGTDKGTIPIGATNWAATLADILKSAGLDVAISVNTSQIGKYAAFFSPAQLIPDRFPFPGPLKGILSAHDRFPAHDLLVVACDMIDLKTATILHLVKNYREHPDHDYFAFHNHDYWEPFAAIYTAEGLKKITREIVAGEQIKGNLQTLLREGKTKKLDIPDHASFKNYNAVTDMRAFQVPVSDSSYW